MAIPASKEELIATIEENYRKLVPELKEIAPAVARENQLPGHAKGTTMSAADLVSYLLGWGELVLKWTKDNEASLPGYQWNELGQLAQKFYTDYEDLDYEELLARLEETVKEILAFIKQTSNKELYGKPWYKKHTLGRMIQLNTASPYKNAHARLRRMKKGARRERRTR